MAESAIFWTPLYRLPFFELKLRIRIWIDVLGHVMREGSLCRCAFNEGLKIEVGTKFSETRTFGSIIT